MSGLLYKNFRINRTSLLFSLITQLLCSAVILLVCFFQGGKPFDEEGANSAVLIFSLLYYLGSMLPAMATSEIFRTDEGKTACSFAMALPTGAKGHVESKYYFILIENLIIMFIGFVTDTLTVALTGGTVSLTMIVVMIFCWRMMISSVEIPFMIRFGSQRGMSIKGAVVGIILMLGWIWFLFGDISFLLDSDDPFEAFIEFMQSGDIIFWLSFFPYISMIMYYLSCRISVKIYRKGAETYEQ
ncbi:MAG: ABC-2 transporter permease [Ruminiclostridium sp.]|nr:ABC-2 transporter permease [Ruminiclostridium sp.]